MRIAVVGAGLAGLTAASRLVAAGHDVVVFEKSRGAGGRMATRVVDLADGDGLESPLRLTFDHGAQHFTVSDDRFGTAVAQWLQDGVVRVRRDRVVTVDAGTVTHGEDAVTRYVGADGMAGIGRSLARGLDVRYGARVDALDLIGRFDRCVVAVPAPQAVPLLAPFAPTLADVAATVRMEACWAALVTFAGPMGGLAGTFDAAFAAASPLSWVARMPAPAPLDSWVVHAGTEWSADYLEDPPEAVLPRLLAAFAALVRADLPPVRYATAHRWRFARAANVPATGALHDRRRGLTVCGDWCLGARVEGAYLSGLAAAAAVLG